MSWQEAGVLEAARSVTAARDGALSRADWLLGMAQVVLQAGAADAALPNHVRQRAAQALSALESERTEATAYPARPGRPPTVSPTAQPAMQAEQLVMPPRTRPLPGHIPN